jgi:calcium/calmodulin-dependent protein kinase I
MRSRLENYDLFEIIGEGSYAVVHRARNRGAGSSNDWPADVAIKIVDEAKMLALQSGHSALPGIDDEIRLWQSLDNPFICKLYETVRDPEGQKVALVMEYCAGGELFDRLSTAGKCTEEEASLIMAELLDALSYMHGKGIVHRDVKPENVCFVAKDREADAGSGPASIRLVDFGYAAVIQPDVPYGPDWCGTPKYVAPEQISSTGHESTAPDLWAAGVVLYIMLCGFPPWSASGGPELFEQIEHAQYSFPSPWWDMVSEDAKQLLRGLLTIDPEQRLTAAQAAVHPWIETCGGALQ